MTALAEARFPPPLAPGDEVALVAPACAVEPAAVDQAVGLLEARGLVVRARDDLTARHRSLAGPDGRRAGELLDALRDPAIRAVFCVRGGYGSQRLLAALPPDPVVPPKPVVGFSDNTALLVHLRDRWGWAVVHGAHPEDPAGLDAALGVLGLFGAPARTLGRDLRWWNPGRGGRVTAEVAGGCLSLLAALAGTPHAFRARGRIVFVEEVAEPVYRIDRMLHQLGASGALDGAAAVVFGRLGSFLPAGADVGPLEHLVAEFARGAPFPVLSGLPAGHTDPNLPVPFGPRAVLDPGAGTLAFAEDAVR